MLIHTLDCHVYLLVCTCVGRGNGRPYRWALY